MRAIILTIVAFFVLGLSVNAQNVEIQERQVWNTSRYILRGDGVTDDTNALNAWGRGERVVYRGRVLGNVLQNGTFLVSWKVEFKRRGLIVRNNTFVWRYRGYNRTDWIEYRRGVRAYNNRIIDIGTGDNPYERRRRVIIRIPR